MKDSEINKSKFLEENNIPVLCTRGNNPYEYCEGR